MNIIRTFSLLSILLVNISIQAIIPYIAKYRKDNKECILVCDAHVDAQGAALSKKQHAALIKYAKAHNAMFIIEDMFNYETLDAAIENALTIARNLIEQGTIIVPGTNLVEYSGLFGCYKQCEQEGIPVVNIEFRQASLANIRYAAHGLQQEAIQAFHILMEAFERVVSELQNYKDTPILNAYYKDVVTKVTPALAHLQKSVGTVLTPAETTQFENNFWLCMVSLLDARLMHEWHIQSKNKDRIIIYAGGEHVVACENLLKKIGYTKVREQGNKDFVSYCIQHRETINSLKLKPVAGWRGALTVFENAATLYRIQRNVNAYAQRCQEEIKKAESVSIEAMA